MGIIAWGDSDFNEFRNNRVTAGSEHGALDAAQWPGSRPARIRPDGIRAYSGTQARSLINVMVAGHLTQTVSDEHTRQEGTVIEGNSVDIPPSASPTNGYAIVVADQKDVRVQGNTVRRALQGLHVSGMMGMLRPPGTCSRNPSRRCLEPRDCFLPGVDASDLGSCSLPPPRYDFSTTTGLRFIGNHILGPLTEPGFNCAPNAECQGTRPMGIGVYPNALDAVVEGNDIANSQFLGIAIILKAVESTVVRNNVVRDSAYALGLIGVAPGNANMQYPAFYGATITRNDFTRSAVRAIYVSSFFTHPAEISQPSARAGNYWGRPCDATNGFRVLDPGHVDAGDSPRADIADHFAFGQPIARRSVNPPTPCAGRSR